MNQTKDEGFARSSTAGGSAAPGHPCASALDALDHPQVMVLRCAHHSGPWGPYVGPCPYLEPADVVRG